MNNKIPVSLGFLLWMCFLAGVGCGLTMNLFFQNLLYWYLKYGKGPL